MTSTAPISELDRKPNSRQSLHWWIVEAPVLTAT